jgi:hypothetical protein
MRGSLHFAFLSCFLLFLLALASSSSLNFCICRCFFSGNIKFHCFQQAIVCQHFLVVFVTISIFKLVPFLHMLFSLWHHQVPLVWTSIHFYCLCGCWLSSFILVLLLPCFLQATLSIHKNDLFIFFMLWKFYWFARICCVHVSLCQYCCNIGFYNFFFLRCAKLFPLSFSLIFFSSVVAITSFDFLMVLKYF